MARVLLPLPQVGAVSAPLPPACLTQESHPQCQCAFPKWHTWGPRVLSSGFQDPGQGLEEGIEGLSPQGLWAENRGRSEHAP